MVNNIPVNGWPQLKDLEAVQPILNRLDKIEAWKRTVKEETFTGDDITIENALALPARSLITEINALQDLHGYDKPWAGGAGKNKLNYSAESFSVDKNWTETLLGTFTCTESVAITASWYQSVALSDSERNTITVTNQATGTVYYATNFTEKALARGYHESPIGYNQPDNKIPAGTYNVKMWAQGISDNYVLTQPMIRLSSDTDTTWKPYSNICPISGRDSVVLTRSDGDEISEDFTIQLGTTVYGAEINWDTGAMTVKTVCPDLGGLTWTADATGVANKNRFYADLSPLAVVADSVNLTSISSQYTLLAPGGTYSANADGYTITAASKIYIYDELLSSATAADFKTAMSGVQIEYTLATPQTIQLTPTQLEMLKGYNRVTLSDGYGTIELKALTGANWS